MIVLLRESARFFCGVHSQKANINSQRKVVVVYDRGKCDGTTNVFYSQ